MNTMTIIPDEGTMFMPQPPRQRTRCGGDTSSAWKRAGKYGAQIGEQRGGRLWWKEEREWRSTKKPNAAVEQ